MTRNDDKLILQLQANHSMEHNYGGSEVADAMRAVRRDTRAVTQRMSPTEANKDVYVGGIRSKASPISNNFRHNKFIQANLANSQQFTRILAQKKNNSAMRNYDHQLPAVITGYSSHMSRRKNSKKKNGNI